MMEQLNCEEMLRKSGITNDSWERQKSQYRVSDIDTGVFQSYLRKTKKAGRIHFVDEDPEVVLVKLGLSDGEWLLNAGAALFVDCGINELQLTKYASDRRLTITDQRRFTGSMLPLAAKAVQYVVDAMDWRVAFPGKLEREEIPEIPVDAVREAVINAFAHRLIASGQPVEVVICRGFLEIHSPGRFPDGQTPELFIRENRKPVHRNPLIVRTLTYSKDMEGSASGLKRMHETCGQSGCKVAYLSDDSGVTVRFYRHCGEGWGYLSQCV